MATAGEESRFADRRLPVLTSLYDLQFPIFLAFKLPMDLYVGVELEDGTKYLRFLDRPRVAIDIILDDESTYLGRLLYMAKTNRKPLEYQYSFVNLAHYIYGRPKTIPPNVLIVDNQGHMREKAPIRVDVEHRVLQRRVNNWIYVRGYPCPIQIPDNPLLHETLDRYYPRITLYEYQGTLFFKNVAPQSYTGAKNVRIL